MPTVTNPKISVVTTSLNHGKYIRDNIESVLAQRYVNFEHIVIDGGSTDDTLDILKSYPHLLWVSEADEGQADALNKGFARASGEIIAWLNSDDWYAPGIFHDVVEALSNYPIIMGICELVDKERKRVYQVENVERTFLDILKYWIPYAIPTQPSVFFRRSLLEEVKRTDGSYVDKSLHYVMDYDLWLRISQRYPFRRRIPKLLAYYRMTDENKSSHEKEGITCSGPEMSKVFQRYSQKQGLGRKRFSFLVPVNEVSDSLRSTLTTILLQSTSDFEVIVAGYGLNYQTKKLSKDLISDYNELEKRKGKSACISFVDSAKTDAFSALNDGIQASQSHLFIVLEPGALLSSDVCEVANEIFRSDRIGFAVPYRANQSLFSRFITIDPNRGDDAFNIEAILEPRLLPGNFLIRKVTWEDIHINTPEFFQLAVREMISQVVFKGWHISVKNDLSITAAKIPKSREELVDVFSGYIAARIVTGIQQDLENEPFARVRTSFGSSVLFSPELVDKCRKLLEASPPKWHVLNYIDSIETLREIVLQYPNFAPGYHYLSKCLERAGDLAEAKEMKRKYTELSRGR